MNAQALRKYTVTLVLSVVAGDHHVCQSFPQICESAPQAADTQLRSDKANQHCTATLDHPAGFECGLQELDV